MNFASDQLGDLQQKGVQDIIERISKQSDRISPDHLVDSCLDLVGPLVLEEKTRKTLVEKARVLGEVDLALDGSMAGLEARVSEMLQLIVATREFQFA